MAGLRFDNTIVIIVFVSMVAVGAVVVFIFANVMDVLNPDPYDHDFAYDVSGTCQGEECSGSAVCVYAPELQGSHVYRIDGSVISATHSEDFSFKAVFGMDDKPMEGTCEFLREDSVGDTPVSVWLYRSDSMEYVTYVGELCKVLRFDLRTPDLALVGNVKS